MTTKRIIGTDPDQAPANQMLGGMAYQSPEAVAVQSISMQVPKVAESVNGKAGVVTLVAGAATVANTGVTAVSRIFLSAQNTSGTPGELSVTARTVGASFTLGSTSNTDTRQVAFLIMEPA